MNEIDVSGLLRELRQTAAAAGGEMRGAQIQPEQDFISVLKESVETVNRQQALAETQAQSFAMGDPQVSLAEVMVSVQKAGIAFQALTQVRNKMVAAYQEIMSMQM